jgi:resuscitation-promoting factor RpfB
MMRRRRLGRNEKLVLSAVAAGLLLAAGHGGGAAALTPADSTVALGQQLASGYGWGSGPQWTCLDELWTRESGWQMVWNTQSSGAYGIPQALPASRMASAGPDYMTDPATQIRWGLGYIASTYGTPCGAWAHEEANSWY